MKRLYVAIAFMIISISLCAFEQYTVKSSYTEATSYIDNALNALENDDYKRVEQSCQNLSSYWDKKYPFLTAMTEHGPLDDASITINSLEELVKSKSDELENELITAKNQIKIVYDNQKITFGNIF